MVNGGLYLASDREGTLVQGAAMTEVTFPGVQIQPCGRIAHGLLSVSTWSWARQGHLTAPPRGGGERR